MRRLAIIPARGNSKRIPMKNARLFCGEPMISHVIKPCHESGLFETIHVSTDSQRIADIAADNGHGPDFLRPDSLSGDHTTMMEVLNYVVKAYEDHGKIYDTVALIYATSPLIDHQDLTEACSIFEKGDKDKALLAVASYPAPIEHAFRLSDTSLLEPNDANFLAMRTQDLQHAYYDAGMFAFYTSNYIKKQKAGGDFNQFRGYVVPSYRVTDIDWPDDWERAEMLFKAIGSSKS